MSLFSEYDFRYKGIENGHQIGHISIQKGRFQPLFILASHREQGPLIFMGGPVHSWKLPSTATVSSAVQILALLRGSSVAAVKEGWSESLSRSVLFSLKL